MSSRIINLLREGSKSFGKGVRVKLRDYSLYAGVYPAGDCVMRVMEGNVGKLINLSGVGRSGVDYSFDKIMSRRDVYHRKGLYKVSQILRGGSNPTMMHMVVYSFIFGVSVGDLFEPDFEWEWGVDFSVGELYKNIRSGELTCRGGDDKFIRMALLG
jgi:hypothetical protein